LVLPQLCHRNWLQSAAAIAVYFLFCKHIFTETSFLFRWWHIHSVACTAWGIEKKLKKKISKVKAFFLTLKFQQLTFPPFSLAVLLEEFEESMWVSLFCIKWQKLNLGFLGLFALLVSASMLWFLVIFPRYTQTLDHRTTFKNTSGII